MLLICAVYRNVRRLGQRQVQHANWQWDQKVATVKHKLIDSEKNLHIHEKKSTTLISCYTVLVWNNAVIYLQPSVLKTVRTSVIISIGADNPKVFNISHISYLKKIAKATKYVAGVSPYRQRFQNGYTLAQLSNSVSLLTCCPKAFGSNQGMKHWSCKPVHILQHLCMDNKKHACFRHRAVDSERRHLMNV